MLLLFKCCYAGVFLASSHVAPNANVKASKQEFTNHWLMASCYIHLLYTVYAGSRQPHDTFPSIFFFLKINLLLISATVQPCYDSKETLDFYSCITDASGH